jgi:hypothetical protein
MICDDDCPLPIMAHGNNIVVPGLGLPLVTDFPIKQYHNFSFALTTNLLYTKSSLE